MRWTLVLLDLCLALASGPMYSQFLKHKLCSLVCKQTPTMQWVLLCFMATENSRFKTGLCEVAALEK